MGFGGEKRDLSESHKLLTLALASLLVMLDLMPNVLFTELFVSLGYGTLIDKSDPEPDKTEFSSELS